MSAIGYRIRVHNRQRPTFGRLGMAATKDARATRAALQILEMGGNAMDAAIAAGAVMHVVDPGSSGIGGDAFILYYDATTQSVTGFNGTEMALLRNTVFRRVRKHGQPKAGCPYSRTR